MAGEIKKLSDIDEIIVPETSDLDAYEEEFDVIASHMHVWGAFASDECQICDWFFLAEEAEKTTIIEAAEQALGINIAMEDLVLDVCKRLRSKHGNNLPDAIPKPPEGEEEEDTETEHAEQN